MESNKFHVLVVDDDDKIRNLIKQFLNENGFIVSTAADAEEAKSKIYIFNFNLMILDVMMPGQDGYDPNYQGGSYKPAVDGTSGNQVVNRPISDDISVKDVNDWATSSETIDKYKERYKEEWQKKLSEVVSKMIRNL